MLPLIILSVSCFQQLTHCIAWTRTKIPHDCGHAKVAETHGVIILHKDVARLQVSVKDSAN